MRILLIEDDETMSAGIEMMVRSNDVSICTARLGREGIDLCKMADYDVILLDLQLPDMDGFDVLETLRLSEVHTPVMILSGNTVVESKVRALDLGADDYITKPFHKEEFLARIQAVLRRARDRSQSIVTTGKLKVDTDAKTVSVDGIPAHLTAKEYQILELLSLRKGAILTKDIFLNHMYGGMDEPDGKIIDVFICKLRRKLGHLSGGDNFIYTVWGSGYVLRDPDFDQAVAA